MYVIIASKFMSTLAAILLHEFMADMSVDFFKIIYLQFRAYAINREEEFEFCKRSIWERFAVYVNDHEPQRYAAFEF